MKYPYAVKVNGRYYPSGADVPEADVPEVGDVGKQDKKKSAASKDDGESK